MKIDSKSQLGLQISEDSDMQMKIISEQVNSIKSRKKLTDFEIQFGTKNTTELVLEDGIYFNQNYIVQNSAMSMVTKIPVDTPKFDIKFLNNLPYKKATFLLGAELAMKYYKTSDNIYAVFYRSEKTIEGTHLIWTFIRINLVTGEIIIPKRNVGMKYSSEENSGFSRMEFPYKDEYFKLFIQLLLFIELSELIIEVIKPNEKIGNRKSGKYINKSNSNISIVNSKWNVISVRNESFMVSGHWRMQPCGKNREQRKMIWIDTFEKNGYIRKGNKVRTSNI